MRLRPGWTADDPARDGIRRRGSGPGEKLGPGSERVEAVGERGQGPRNGEDGEGKGLHAEGPPIMRRTTTTIAALGAAVFELAGHAVADGDVAGWRSTKWGMTETEVQKALVLTAAPAAPKPQDTTYAAWKMPLTLVDQDYEVSLIFGRETRRLEIVRIEGKADDVGLRYRNLRDLLVARHGPPVRIPNRQHGFEDDLEWRFKSTTIRLGTLRLRGVVDSMSLTYISTELGRSDREKQ